MRCIKGEPATDGPDPADLHKRVSLWVVAFDFAAVTAFLLGCVVVNRAIVATNSQFFFYYFYFVIVIAPRRARTCSPASTTAASSRSSCAGRWRAAGAPAIPSQC